MANQWQDDWEYIKDDTRWHNDAYYPAHDGLLDTEHHDHGATPAKPEWCICEPIHLKIDGSFLHRPPCIQKYFKDQGYGVPKFDETEHLRRLIESNHSYIQKLILEKQNLEEVAKAIGHLHSAAVDVVRGLLREREHRGEIGGETEGTEGEGANTEGTESQEGTGSAEA